MNYLVADFSQFNVMSDRIDRNPEAAQTGACHSFALHWLRLVLSNSSESPSDRLAKIKRSGGGLNLLLNDVYCRHLGHIDACELEQSDRMMMRLRGLKALPAARSWSRYELIGDLYSRWGAFSHLYHFILGNGGRQGEDRSAHSVAFYSSSASAGLTYFFDPNIGEFHMTPEELPPFWQMHQALHYGTPFWHMVRQVEVGGSDNVGGG